eukprot:1160599-Pelagomonas_calceolata.AAC.4
MHACVPRRRLIHTSTCAQAYPSYRYLRQGGCPVQKRVRSATLSGTHSFCCVLQVAVERDDALEAGDLVVYVEPEEPAVVQGHSL